MKTLAAILEEVNQPLALREVEIPALRAGQVLVDVKFSSVCHTQLNEIRGRKGADRFLPHTLGHEGSGIVLEVGSGVTKVKAGDKVVLTWLAGEGATVFGTEYREREGGRVINSGPVSTFLRQAVVSESRVLPVDGVPLDLLPLLGCAIPTGYGVVQKTLKPAAGSSIAIWGAGGIGLSAILAARAARCQTIIAVDIHPEKLRLAEEVGATHLVDGGADPVTAIRALTAGKGVDFALECAGSIQVVESAFAAIRKGGGRLVVAGNPPHGQKLSLDPFDLIAGKNIAGTWGGESHPETDLPAFARAFQGGQLPLEKLVTHRGKLEEINGLLEMMETGKAGRVVVSHA
jgi:S-(hydroxymethyl)glutathione dehydrogenase/alcohol dehydrogenase